MPNLFTLSHIVHVTQPVDYVLHDTTVTSCDALFIHLLSPKKLYLFSSMYVMHVAITLY